MVSTCYLLMMPKRKRRRLIRTFLAPSDVDLVDGINQFLEITEECQID